MSLMKTGYFSSAWSRVATLPRHGVLLLLHPASANLAVIY
jgi:hypothetical protein